MIMMMPGVGGSAAAPIHIAFRVFGWRKEDEVSSLPQCCTLLHCCVSPSFLNDCVTFMSTSGAIRRTTYMQLAIYRRAASPR